MEKYARQRRDAGNWKETIFENKNWHHPLGGHRFKLGYRYHVEIKDKESNDGILVCLKHNNISGPMSI